MEKAIKYASSAALYAMLSFVFITLLLANTFTYTKGMGIFMNFMSFAISKVLPFLLSAFTVWLTVYHSLRAIQEAIAHNK